MMVTKLAKKSNWIIVLLSLFIFSCSSDDGGDVSPDTEGEIAFTSAPFALNGIEANFAADLSYGDAERNVFDIFLPESATPTPLIIYIHGGGFTGGDKANAYGAFQESIKTFLGEGIAYATINYSLLQTIDQEGVIKSLNDSKRCLQYLRSEASTFNIDPNKIIVHGASAGAGTALWLATRDDMADPSNSDPVLRESTRIQGAVAIETQCTYDLVRWETDVFTDYGFTLNQALLLTGDQLLNSFYGMSDRSELDSPAIVEYRKNVDMLQWLSPDDPEMFLDNRLQPVVYPASLNLLYHHANHVAIFQSFAESAQVKTVAYYGDTDDPSGEDFVGYSLRILK